MTFSIKGHYNDKKLWTLLKKNLGGGSRKGEGWVPSSYINGMELKLGSPKEECSQLNLIMILLGFHWPCKAIFWSKVLKIMVCFRRQWSSWVYRAERGGGASLMGTAKGLYNICLLLFGDGSLEDGLGLCFRITSSRRAHHLGKRLTGVEKPSLKSRNSEYPWI